MTRSRLQRRGHTNIKRSLRQPEQLEQRRLLAVFNVNTSADSIDAEPGDGLAVDIAGNTSLRAAIMEANALPGDDQINLPAGTYPLTLTLSYPDNFTGEVAGDLDVTDRSGGLTIIGAGSASTVIDAAAVVERVLHVHRFAALDLQSVRITGGTADEGSGGGLLIEGDTILQSVLIDGNQAFRGGGVFHASGDVEISQSTISNNQAVFEGAGLAISAFSSEGDSSSLSLENATISGNQVVDDSGVGGGIYYASEQSTSVQLTHVTIANNTAVSAGGIAGPVLESSVFSIQASIIAGNASADELDLIGGFTSLGSNIIGWAVPGSGFVDRVRNDLVGSSTGPLDPLLRPLATSASSSIPVHRLQLASSAVDHVNIQPIPSAVDARGRSRSLDAAPDSGAFEFVGGTILPATFHDLNRNSIQDPGETIVPFEVDLQISGQLDVGGTVSLRQSNSEPIVRLEQGIYNIAALFLQMGQVLPTLVSAFVEVEDESTDVALFGGYRYGEIRGYKFDDLGGDGQDASDPRLDGIEFSLFDLGPDGLFGTGDDVPIRFSSTDDNGLYSFEFLVDGRYQVVETNPESRLTTTAAIPVIEIVAGSLAVPSDNFQLPDPTQAVEIVPSLAVGNALAATIRGRVFLDRDENGFDTADLGISTFEITALGAGGDGEFDSADDVPLLTTTSAIDGTYAFDDVPEPGRYRVEIALRDHYFATTAVSLELNVPGNAVVISDAGRRIELSEGQTELIEAGLAFGVQRFAGIYGITFDDLNADGDWFLTSGSSTPDPGETHRGGQRVDLYRQQPGGAFDLLRTTTSQDSPASPQHGVYAFEDLAPGVYAIDQVLAPERGLTSPELSFTVSHGEIYFGAGIGVTSATAPLEAFEVGIIPREPVGFLDAGSRELVELSGNIASDVNASGARDAGEVGLAGWQVVLQRTERLYQQDSLPATRSAITDSDGNYMLRVWPGQYEIAEILEPGFEPTGPQYRFENYQGFGTGGKPSISKVSDVVLADLNADGLDEIIVANDFADIVERSSSLEIFFSSDSGERTRVVLPLGLGMRPQHLLPVDFDQDGDQDLIVAAAGNGGLLPTASADLAFGDVLIFRNDAGNLRQLDAAGQVASGPLRQGTQGAPVANSIGGNSPTYLSYGDFNGDSWIDLVIVNGVTYDPLTNSSVDDVEDLSIAFQTAPGVFTKMQTIDLSTQLVDAAPISTAVGDFNGDGIADIAVGVTNRQRVDLFFGSQGGSFSKTPSSSLTGLRRPMHLLAHDLDMDGLDDLIVTDYLANELVIYPQTHTGLVSTPHRVATGVKPQWIAIGDVNADSTPDIVLTLASTNAVQTVFNLGAHLYSTASTEPENLWFTAMAPQELDVAFGKLSVGHVDQDSFADVGIAHFTGGVTVHPNVLTTYEAWLEARPAADAMPLLGTSGFTDFLPEGTVGLPPASVDELAPTVRHSQSISIGSFVDASFSQQQSGGSFANLEVGRPVLPPMTQVLAAEAIVLTRHNYMLPLDVTADGLVSPLDVLVVVNSLNNQQTSGVVATHASLGPGMVDVSGDGQVTAIDALLVVNHLNLRALPDNSPQLRTQVTPSDLQGMANLLISEFVGAGLPGHLAEQLRGISFEIADLPENILAKTERGTVFIDHSAAGWGWAIDFSPRVVPTSIESVPPRRADLRSTLAHEFGHVLGLRERYAFEGDIMNPRLRLGQRTATGEAIRQLLDELLPSAE